MKNKRTSEGINKLCRGCGDIVKQRQVCGSGLIPTYEYYGKKFNCPCIECLIKSMCLTPCDEWGNYSDMYYELIKTEDENGEP